MKVQIKDKRVLWYVLIDNLSALANDEVIRTWHKLGD